MITVELARECFYLPEGHSVPHWRVRPVSHFFSASAAKTFNTRFAGRPAGTTARHDRRRRIVFSIRGTKQIVYAYHVVWMLVKGAVPAAQLDHKNTDCTDDSVGNLREATQSQNNANIRMWSHNTSGVKGVSWRPDKRCYRAYIKIDGRYRHLGHYATIEAASAAYRTAAQAAFGEFARHA